MGSSTTSNTPTASMSRWSPPGPGQWSLDRSHYSGGATPITQWLLETGMESGTGRVFAELGAPVGAISARFVNGFMYTRTVPLIRPDQSATKLPPAWILRLASRIHPEFRQRNQRAAAAFAHRPGPAVVKRWTQELKPATERRCREFAAADLAGITDEALATHCQELLDHLSSNVDLHFWLHGYDLAPIARYVAFTISSGIPTAEAVTALAGASGSTTRPREQLVAIRTEIGDAQPANLAELRSISTTVARMVDDYLDERGTMLVTSYDLTGLTLGELPETLFASIMGASDSDEAVDDRSGADSAARLRAKIPEGRREQFDERLRDAREVMDMRDDNGPALIERPMGLLRLALLEAGRRLVERGRLRRTEHALELAHDEVVPMISEGRGPSAHELGQRALTSAANSRLTPPAMLGSVELVPPAELLPPPLAELATTVQVAMVELGMVATGEARDPLSGTGIGSSSYIGRARCAETPEQAIAALEPGDVLVVRATSPAFNAVLMIAGAVVTADGGPLSHAAVLARELGIPAVVGAFGALDIPDGAEVEVDPVAGKVRVRS